MKTQTAKKINFYETQNFKLLQNGETKVLTKLNKIIKLTKLKNLNFDKTQFLTKLKKNGKHNWTNQQPFR